MKVLRLKKGKEESLDRFHPWVFSGALAEPLPEGLEGFHFHALCESSSQDLEKVLDAFFSQYGKWIPQLKWLNMTSNDT